MFTDDTLKNHFETSSTIKLQSLILAEWNMNMPDNIFKVGNYRYRPLESNVQYKTVPSTFDPGDSGNYYTNGTDADVVINGGVDDSDVPVLFKSKKEKMNMLYSLEDCIKPFRPRSGINKPLYFSGTYINNGGANIAQRPRYYMPSRYDQFRYWTSYRTENNLERGIAKNKVNSINYIDDVAPFVVYNEEVPANRIVVKMQTNIGDVDLGPFTNASKTFQDPLAQTENKTTPVNWRIEYLKGNNWVQAYKFDESSLRDDTTAIIKSDGYLELQYGLIVPRQHKAKFVFAETLSSSSLLPEQSSDGYSYLVIENENTAGSFYIWNAELSDYEIFAASYGWSVGEENIANVTSFVTDFTSPSYFNNTLTQSKTYREFEYIRGIRIVVDTMNKFDSTFDLIEMSPRLVGNLSDSVIDFRVTKSLSDIGNTSLPVGQLLASTGDLSIFDHDRSFNINNTNSIISKYVRKNIKFLFYENIVDVEGYNYYVPIKTLYSEGFPQESNESATLTISLRDFYFFLESNAAPRMLVTQVSLSYAITMLLDYIGFTNYSFKRLPGEQDVIIPYFFVSPDKNVAEVLQSLAIATQSSMFFDEYNNFIVMSKDYMMPSISERDTDFVLNAQNNQADTGLVENVTINTLPNIISINSEDRKVFNDGKINYTTRYIQRSYGSIRQSSLIDAEKTWIYKPVLLWEVAGTDNLKTINEVASKQSSYVLGAMPINSNLAVDLPYVLNNKITNNIIDVGENAYWLTRYNGYFYSNGEIIKYDAVQFSITLPIWYPIKKDGSLDETSPQIVLPGKLAPESVGGNLKTTLESDNAAIQQWRNTHRQGSSNVWISSNQEYQKFAGSLPFNGKIYPTGLVRIYTVPFYQTLNGITKMKNGQVQEHGRGQFGTTVASHSAGIDTYWTSTNYVRGCNMQSKYLFSTEVSPSIPSTVLGLAGEANSLAKQSTRNSVIKNFMSTSSYTETDVSLMQSTKTGTVQSSALVMSGPSFAAAEVPLNFISYVYKNLNNAYKHFGTRMRIVGKIENSTTRGQSPVGSMTYYQVNNTTPDKSISIGGGSGGLAIMVNPETNNGYYFEIVALTETNVESYLNLNSAGQTTSPIDNILFYKVKKNSANSEAIPVKLWGGLSSIVVDDGKFTGQSRVLGEENPTVYDLSVEYQDIGKIRRFYLYINNKLIKIVDDQDPLPVYNNMALFTRGSSKCMFENIYAVCSNYSQNTVSTVSQPISNVFGETQNSNTFNKDTNLFNNNEINISESFRKYAMSGVVQSTYLSGISSQQPPKYNMYFDEFGTIMRECAYFNIKYDRAYPALYAELSPTFNRIKGYTTSGFYADSYGAEFLIFNATDSALNLDETSGNYLRIQGITFTQDTTHELSVDSYFGKRSSLSDPELKGDVLVYSPYTEQQKYNDIKLSRITYGKNDFTIDSEYIQTDDAAQELMGWIINKTMKPKKSIGLEIFSTPILQLGDIVTINYTSENFDVIAPETTRFVIYNIEYSRNQDGPSMIIYLSEV
jgi:hypothetical protein